MTRAVALDSLGRTDEAVPDLQAITEILPPSHELNRLVTELLADMGNSD